MGSLTDGGARPGRDGRVRQLRSKEEMEDAFAATEVFNEKPARPTAQLGVAGVFRRPSTATVVGRSRARTHGDNRRPRSRGQESSQASGFVEARDLGVAPTRGRSVKACPRPGGGPSVRRLLLERPRLIRDAVEERQAKPHPSHSSCAKPCRDNEGL